MTSLRVIVARVFGFFCRRRRESRLEEELRCHLEMLEEENRRRGMLPDDAAQAARKEFGALVHAKEQCRDAGGFTVVEEFLQDLHHAARGMGRSPGFSLLVIAVLAVGIGGATTVYGILNTLFYRPLRYPNPEQLVMMGEAYTRGQQVGPMAPVRYQDFEEWKKQPQSFEHIVAYRPESFVVRAGTEPERVRGERVGPGYFEMLGVRPLLGRDFSRDDSAPGAPAGVILSEEYWRRALSGYPNVIGLRVHLNGTAATVVGVMPGRLRATLIEGGPRLWAPLAPSAGELRVNAPNLSVLARLKPGATIDTARAEMTVIGKRLAGHRPAADRDPTIRVDGLQQTLAGAASAPVVKVLIMAVSLLVLISCANVANLFLGRGAERRREVALRAALGAGRFRLIRQFLAESLAFALTGGLAGVALAVLSTGWCSRKMAPLLANDGIEKFAIDERVLVCALAISLVTAVLFGILPAFRASRVNICDTLKESGPGHSAGGARQRLNGVLVGVEVTLSVVLVTSAGLLLNSIWHYWRVDFGIPLERRLTMLVAPIERVYDGDAKRVRFYEQLLYRTARLPGVEAAALVNAMPVHMGSGSARVAIEGSQAVQAGYRIVSAGYHAAAGLPMRRGRSFSETDDDGHPLVALVSESLAAKLWPGREAIGAPIEVNGKQRIVVGVSSDVTQGMMTGSKHEVSVPYRQVTANSMRVLVKVAGDPASVVAGLRQAVHALDPDLPVSEVQTLRAAKDQLGAPFEFLITLLCSFAVAAVLLASAGIYSVTSRAVSIRTREIGIRMALGADPKMVMGSVLRHGLKLALTGTAMGTLLAAAMIKILLTRIWWMSPVSGFAWLLPVALFMAAVAVTASLVPARRATAIGPSQALRSE